MSDCVNQATGLHKKTFRTRADAKRRLAYLKTNPSHSGKGLHVYRCPDCNWLHIGHDWRTK